MGLFKTTVVLFEKSFLVWKSTFYPQYQLLSTYFNIAFISVILCRIIHCSLLPPSRRHFLGFKSLENISLKFKKVSFLSSLSSASTNSFNFEHENELLEHQKK